MSYDRVRSARRRTIGTNQTLKALEQESLLAVYVAEDAERRILGQVLALCRQKGVPVNWVESMKALGKACGIEVGAATVGIVDE